jgi:hypothetical protein
VGRLMPSETAPGIICVPGARALFWEILQGGYVTCQGGYVIRRPTLRSRDPDIT